VHLDRTLQGGTYTLTASATTSAVGGNSSASYSIAMFAIVPEPASGALLAVGATVLIAMALHRSEYSMFANGLKIARKRSTECNFHNCTLTDRNYEFLI
jgi:hypothetical protein